MIIAAFIILFLVMAASASYLFIMLRTPKGGQPQLPTATLKIGDRQYTVELAETSLSRTRGLSGRTSLQEGRGMLFIFPVAAQYGFWMKDMLFPIDIVWITQGKVADITANVPAPNAQFTSLPSYKPKQSVEMVLELPAGAAQKDGIIIGAQVELLRDK